MLEIVLDLGRIADGQAHYRQQGTVAGTRVARHIMAMRDALKHEAARYRERRDRALAKGNTVLLDGRQSTVHRKVLDPFGQRQWPTVEAAILQGARQPGVALFPSARCPRPGADWVGCHDAYLFMLYDSAPDARTFPDLAALAIYPAPANVITILWIGLEDDAQAQADRLAAETAGWADLAAISPDAHAFLGADCLFYGKRQP